METSYKLFQDCIKIFGDTQIHDDSSSFLPSTCAISQTFSSEFWYEIRQSSPMREEERRRIVLQRFSCCMNGSGHLEEDLRQSMHLCPVDLRKLQTLCGFDVVERYRRLLGFFERKGLKEEGGLG